MRKSKRRNRIPRVLSYKNREVRISNSALDFYKKTNKNKNAMDLMVQLYDSIIKIILKNEEKFIKNEKIQDISTKEIRIKLSGLNRPFEISLWTERDYRDGLIKTSIFIGLKASNVLLNLSKVEDELTERFLKG